MTSLHSPRTRAASPHGAARTYWREVLLAGGATRLPRWTVHPVAGTGEHELRVPAGCVSELKALAAAWRVPFSALLLAAHVRVLATLSGEREVCTGYSWEGSPPLPCRLSAEGRTWRQLAVEAWRVRSALLTHRDFPVETLQHALGLTEPLYEAAIAVDGGAGLRLAADVVLQVTFLEREDAEVLQLRYRTDALDGEAAARIAGYHLAALSAMAAAPEAPPFQQSLLSAAEVRWQHDALAGPWKVRPDRRAHELFEEQVRRRPFAIAATDDAKALTYRVLNARANRLAHALLDRGLEREEVVGVVTERTIDWLTAVLAILKAGGAYLPIEPHFPADRIAWMLTRAGCRRVLTEATGRASLDQALATIPGVEALLLETALREDHDSRDPGLAIPADQLAYVYFTSGSTGEPKGAMCEHAGMLNHLLAKIEDLRLGADDAVAQTAPQCFDISLWQLLAPLLAGGRTVLIPQETILDAGRFLDRIVAEGVAVIQVVPSYLDVLVSHLAAHPRALPTLRSVSTTGEALKAELVERWFAAQPGIPLVNAYGLTETSDDTNHEILTHPPREGRVPLGRPLGNIRIAVVDDRLGFVPLGAPGELVFSGICVGRGYINDPERTRLAFLPDPAHPGGRMYRSGDYGRWRPDGKLEFLGRRDAQVKVNGFRIEIGEVENRLLRLPGVRDGAVVVIDRADGSKQMVGFYAADEPLESAAMRDALSASLPWYMIPSAMHWQATLPATANGKIDKRALATLARELEEAPARGEAPHPGHEAELARAWAGVLGIPPEQIGRQDHFFDLGGTSLSALRLVIALGRALSFKEIATHPILAEQAAALAHAHRPTAESTRAGSRAT